MRLILVFWLIAVRLWLFAMAVSGTLLLLALALFFLFLVNRRPLDGRIGSVFQVVVVKIDARNVVAVV